MENSFRSKESGETEMKVWGTGKWIFERVEKHKQVTEQQEVAFPLHTLSMGNANL